MKRYRIYLIGLLALMASCVGDDHSQQRAQQSLGGDDSQGVPITFTYTALQVDTAATRSAASATLSDAVIEANQAVTVRVSQHGQSQFSSYTFTSASGGVLTPPQQAPTYPINGASVDIRAFTPSSAATGTFTVQQHQETNAGYIASDLMWTKVDNQSSSASPVPLTFVHKMAKVRVTAHAGTAISSINQIRLVNVKPTVTFDYDGSSGALGAATGSTTVYLFTEGTGNTATGVACIPPQTFTNTNLLAVDVTLADGTSTGTVYYRVDSKQFAGSKLYSLDVTVSRLQVGTTITISGWTDSNPVNTTSGGEFTIADIPAQTYSVSGSTPAVTVSYMGSALTSSDYDVYYYSNVDAGTAYVGVLGKNHYAGVHGIKSFTINKANPTYTAPTKKTNLVYNGSAQALADAGSSSHGSFTYCATQNGTYSSTIPTGTNVASNYAVYWKFTGDKNHNDDSGSLTNITIAKASSSMSNGSGDVSFASSNAINFTTFRTISCAKCSVSGVSVASGSGFSVSRYGNTITVTRTSSDAFSGSVTVTGTAINDNYTNPSSITISVSGEAAGPSSSDLNGHAYIDLGNPSCYYATMNVGASSEGDWGSYFAWGETTTKSSYSDSNYTASSISTDLSISQDAARANWGGAWRMPTKAELQWLIENCTWTWTTSGGNNGYRVTSKISGYTSNSIFLPAAGYYYGSSVYSRGTSGDYWSSTYDDSSDAWYLYFHSSSKYMSGSRRNCGLSVRPVLSK